MHKAMPQPVAPSVEEWVRHQLTHIPFKGWCPICIQAKAKNPAHKKNVRVERKLPVVSMDYMFMSKKPDNDQLMYPILVMKDRKSGGIWTIPTDRKGKSGLNVVPRVIEVLNGLGYHRIVLKTDQENAITDLQAEVRLLLHKEIVELQEQVKRNAESRSSSSGDTPSSANHVSCEIILENSPVGESQANGLVERAIQEIQGHIRAVKFQLEKRIGGKIESSSPIWPWVIDYASKLFRYCHVHGSDKRTTMQRLKGTTEMPEIAQFGEIVMWKPAKTVQIEKNEEKWRMVIWLGFLEHSGEYIIGTGRGIVKCHAARRLDEVGNFDARKIEDLRGRPWQPVPGRLSMRIPTNIDTCGKVTNDKGEVDGHDDDVHEYKPSLDS